MVGNVVGNKPISEYIYLILEPVAKRQEGMEIKASSGLLDVIESLNVDLSNHEEENPEDSNLNQNLENKNIQELMR